MLNIGKRYGLSQIWDSFCSPQGNKQGPIKRSPGLTTGRTAAARLGVISWKIGGIALPDALTDNHHSTLHAFFLAAKEGGYTEFELQFVATFQRVGLNFVSALESILKSVPNSK